MNIVAMVSLATMVNVILRITNIENLIVVNKKDRWQLKLKFSNVVPFNRLDFTIIFMVSLNFDLIQIFIKSSTFQILHVHYQEFVIMLEKHLWQKRLQNNWFVGIYFSIFLHINIFLASCTCL